MRVLVSYRISLMHGHGLFKIHLFINKPVDGLFYTYSQMSEL